MITRWTGALLFAALAFASIRYLSRSRLAATSHSLTAQELGNNMTTLRPQQPEEWRAALAALPETSRIPAFFFAHGSPSLIAPKTDLAWRQRMGADGTSGGRQEAFLRDFGPALLSKYDPKAILVFSAHWDSGNSEEILVSDYEPRNPLLYDYYNFQPSFYDIDFVSRGDAALSRKIVGLLNDAGIPSRLLGKNEPRGYDGKTNKPGSGLDHGCYVPFSIMFRDYHGPEGFDVPIVQVAIHGGRYEPAKEQALGAAVRSLRDEGVLILSGGLVYHNLRNFAAFQESKASAANKDWNNAVLESVETPMTVQERHKAVAALEKHPGFRGAHPEADHFAPIWVAEGAGSEDAEGNGVRVLSALYGAHTYAFL